VIPESLSHALEDYLGGSRNAVVLEDGAIAFDLASAKYSVRGEHNKCLLQLWSAERNIVRRVLDSELKNGALRLTVQRMGQAKPTKLEICLDRDRRPPSAKKAARSAYQGKLRRVLERHFPGFAVGSISTAMDLERSFGPIYARGLIRQGHSAFAVLGVNQYETQASVDAALTFGILWLDCCRERQAGRVLVEGLKLFLPAGTSSLTRERMAQLNRDAAKWQLYELDEQSGELQMMDCGDRGNIATRLVHCPDDESVRQRFASSIERIRELLPSAEVTVLSAGETAFRCRGLEFARARISHEPGSFRSGQEIVFGVGAAEQVLDEYNESQFAELLLRAAEVRNARGPRHHPLWHIHPERWLESLVVTNAKVLDERLDSDSLYSQVPAFSARDRAMIDALATTRDARLAVIELKADEDIHLPLQGLDYWSRVEWHHARSEFSRYGYFPGKELSPQPPLLFLVAPALHVHPATDTLLRYMSPAIEWALLGIDERWREGVKVVFRKRAGGHDVSHAA
jgi:hypothetical protein